MRGRRQACSRQLSVQTVNENVVEGPSPTGRGCREAAGEGSSGPESPSSGASRHLLPVGEGRWLRSQEFLQCLRHSNPFIGSYTSVTNADHAVGVACDIPVVGDEDDRIAFGVEAFEESENFLTR
jgi:hypothetical protein